MIRLLTLIVFPLIFISGISQVNKPEILQSDFEIGNIEKVNQSVSNNFYFSQSRLILGSEASVTTNLIAVPFTLRSDVLAVGFSVYSQNQLSEYLELTFFAYDENFNLLFESNSLFDSHLQGEKETIPYIHNSSLQIYPAEVKYISVNIKRNQGSEELNLYNLRLVFIDPDKSTTVKSDKIHEETEDFPKPPVMTRTQWGSPIGQSTNCGNPPSTTIVTHLIVHHTTDANTNSNWSAVVRAIYQYHTVSNGWCDIGYNYLIDPNGVIYEGRGGGDNVTGAHFCGYNGGTMGVSMIGTYTSVTPTQAALLSLARILAWKADQRNLDPLGIAFHQSSGRTIHRISGHRDGCATECPGGAMYSILPTVRNDVLALLQNTPPTVTSANPVNNTENFKVFKPVKISFSTLMDTASVRSAISFSPPAQFTLKWVTQFDLEVKPAPLWQFSTAYTFKIDTTAVNFFGAKIDGDGNGVPGDPYFLTFSTSAPDNTPPQIVKYYPQGSNVNNFAEFMIVFDEEIQNIESNIVLEESNGTPVALTSIVNSESSDRGILTFKSSALLKINTGYNLTLKGAIQDRLGNQIGSDIISSFTTIPVAVTDGTFIDRFESISGWVQPKISSFSSGIDTLGTSFEISAIRRKGGQTSGRLIYKFAADNGIIHVENNPGINIAESATSIGIWIFGSLSFNNIYLNFNGAFENKIFICEDNFYGWRFYSYPVNNSGSQHQLFTGLIIEQKPGSDISGNLYFDNLQINGVPLGIDDFSVQPTELTLYRNYPNPFNPSTGITFYLHKSDFVNLDVYDITGNLIESLISSPMESGFHKVNYDGRNLSSGVYFYVLRSAGKTLTGKMLLLK